jgi:uncharacterized protein
MEHIYNDMDFMKIIESIINKKDFIITQHTIHHGLKKIDHSIKVSYYSYIIAKKYNLDYVSVARGGMLHDFYYSNTNGKFFNKDSAKLVLKHNKIALINANKYFKLNEIEKDIIYKHMFPVVLKFPKYKESLLVAIIDKTIGSFEFLLKGKSILSFKVLSKVIPTYILLANALR